MDTQDRKSNIVDKAEQLDIVSTQAWSELDALATRVSVEQIDVVPESVVINDNDSNFKGGMNIFLNLQYGPENDEGFSSATSFWGTFEGHFEGSEPVIDTVAVDTSPFYA
jgi:hypothetical protein